jgi:hypothetical protein
MTKKIVFGKNLVKMQVNHAIMTQESRWDKGEKEVFKKEFIYSVFCEYFSSGYPDHIHFCGRERQPVQAAKPAACE